MFLRKALLVWTLIALVSAVAVPSSALAQQGSAVNGRATDVGGTALSGVEVSLVKVQPVMPGMTMAPPAPIMGRSNPDGTFAVNAVPAGDYILQVDAPGYARYSQQVTIPTNQTFNVKLDALEIPGAVEPSPAAAAGANSQVLQERINALEQRVRDLEATTVLSEPETRTKKTTVYVDKNSNVYDHPADGTKPTVTYQRERVYRRENINEKIEAALSDEAEHKVQVGVNAAIAPQAVFQTKGPKQEADRHAYQLASADLFFTARVAQHTLFFADVVGLSGPPPDLETGGLTLLNGFSARLVNQNELNLALEAALATLGTLERLVEFSTSEVFGQHAFNVQEGHVTSIGSVGEARWTYAVSKLAGEHMAHAYAAEHGLPAVSVRPFNIFGPGQIGGGAIRAFIEAALAGHDLEIHGDGSQIRAWCYVDDMVEAVLLALEHPAAIGESFNIGNARSAVTIYDLATRIKRLTRCPGEIRFVPLEYTDVELRIPNVEKARSLLGFEAQVELDEGLARTIAWYRARLGTPA